MQCPLKSSFALFAVKKPVLQKKRWGNMSPKQANYVHIANKENGRKYLPRRRFAFTAPQPVL
jgi:hypothetical protein